MGGTFTLVFNDTTGEVDDVKRNTTSETGIPLSDHAAIKARREALGNKPTIATEVVVVKFSHKENTICEITVGGKTYIWC